MTRRAPMALVAALTLAGCVSADMDSPPRPEKQYRTGSNIPRRDGSLPDNVGTATPNSSDASIIPPNMPRPLPGGR